MANGERAGEPVEFCLPTRCPACGFKAVHPYAADFACGGCRVVFTPAALAVGRQIAERAEFEARGRPATKGEEDGR